MNFTQNQPLDAIWASLFVPYMERVPDVKKITQAMIHEGIISSQADILNDHVAFRTMGVPHLGIQSLEKIFLYHGYTKRDPYFFAEKKLDAFWYAPPSPEYPRIFLSELRVNDLSEKTQQIIRRYTDTVTSDPVDALNLDDTAAIGQFFHQPLWALPTLADYQALAEESEYAAWVIYNRYYLNHYTISVHNLPEGYRTLGEFNVFLEKIGIKLNTSGGKIKTSPDQLLLQSSSVAEMIPATFAQDEATIIAGSYVEFAERRVLPQFSHLPASEITAAHRREGFEAQNADKIFESTYSEQTMAM